MFGSSIYGYRPLDTITQCVGGHLVVAHATLLVHIIPIYANSATSPLKRPHLANIPSDLLILMMMRSLMYLHIRYYIHGNEALCPSVKIRYLQQLSMHKMTLAQNHHVFGWYKNVKSVFNKHEPAELSSHKPIVDRWCEMLSEGLKVAVRGLHMVLYIHFITGDGKVTHAVVYLCIWVYGFNSHTFYNALSLFRSHSLKVRVIRIGTCTCIYLQ